MKVARLALLGLFLVSAFALAAHAQNADKKDKKKPAPDLAQLVPQEVLDKLELKDEQKDKYDRLQKQFATKVADARKSMAEDMKKAKADKDQAAVKRITAGFRVTVEQARSELEPRFVALLDDGQKKKYEELKGEASAGATLDGKIKSLDPNKGVLVLTVDGKNQTIRLSRATKIVNKEGKELPDGLNDKKLAPGAQVTVTLEKARPGQTGAAREVKLNDG